MKGAEQLPKDRRASVDGPPGEEEVTTKGPGLEPVADDGAEKTPRPEREQTDQSLRAERKNTDQALAEQRTDLEQNADQVVEKARQQADAVLDTAREKADQKLDTPAPGSTGRFTVIKARAAEDEVLQDERAVADEVLRLERVKHARALGALMPLEREKTDRYLLTERARSDDALAHRDDFLGIVTHDLRNLLSGIVVNAADLCEQVSETDEGRRTAAGMARIQRYGARMNRLIGDLVDVVSLDAGKLAIEARPGNLADLLAEAVDAFEGAAAEKGILLESRAAGHALEGDFDHDRLLQVLANLITNAIKFSPHGSAIVVRGERVGEELRISVSDSGSGIPSEMLELVFERFWQLGKNDRRGLGLGLYISRCIVDAHGGKIWVDSKPGKGSVFFVTLPSVNLTRA